MKVRNIYVCFCIALLSSCTVIRPGEVGFKQKLGKLKKSYTTGGARWYNPFVTKIIKINTRTVEVYNELMVPTKEGLSVKAELSLLYHLNPDSARDVYTKLGVGYEETMVLSNFRATTREISARYFAKELYATEREKIEKAIAEQLSIAIAKHGFVVDAVLLKDIMVPDQITKAIQNKVEAEQAALQMDFVIQKQKKEAERMIIEAEGIKQAQTIINEALSEKALQYKTIEMMKSLVNSPNAKIIITDGKSPVMMNTGH